MKKSIQLSVLGVLVLSMHTTSLAKRCTATPMHDQLTAMLEEELDYIEIGLSFAKQSHEKFKKEDEAAQELGLLNSSDKIIKDERDTNRDVRDIVDKNNINAIDQLSSLKDELTEFELYKDITQLAKNKEDLRRERVHARIEKYQVSMVSIGQKAARIDDEIKTLHALRKKSKNVTKNELKAIDTLVQVKKQRKVLLKKHIDTLRKAVTRLKKYENKLKQS